MILHKKTKLKIRNTLRKSTSLMMAFVFLFQMTYPTQVWALTGGPSQPEVQSFEPIGTSDMVDLFTGDFNYNIPLMEVEGYPINIAYHSSVGMDQEASMVGLGWNINPGVINRNMRGLPDDFSGDVVTKELNIKPNKTWGVGLEVDIELYGFEAGSTGSGSIGFSFGFYIIIENPHLDFPFIPCHFRIVYVKASIKKSSFVFVYLLSIILFISLFQISSSLHNRILRPFYLKKLNIRSHI